jgi:hypothetical protein
LITIDLEDWMRAVFCGIMLFCFPIAKAAAFYGDTILFRGTVGGLFDDNVFRLPFGVKASTPNGIKARGDEAIQWSGGLLLDKTISLHKVHLDIFYHGRDYASFNQLNFSGLNVDGWWNWQLGKHLVSMLGYSRKVDLVNYAFYKDQAKNLQTEQLYYFRPSYSLTGGWRLNGALERAEYSVSLFPLNNWVDDSIEIGIDRLSNLQNTIGLFAKFHNGSFPERNGNTTEFPKNYNQFDINLRTSWDITGLSRLDGTVGWTDRRLGGQNYNGITGRLSYLWNLTTKTSVLFSAQRQLQFAITPSGGSAWNQVVSLEPKWNPTPMMSVTASFQFSDYKYTVTKRNQQFLTFGLQSSYKPIKNLELLIAAQHQTGKSSVQSENFDDNLVRFTTQMTF